MICNEIFDFNNSNNNYINNKSCEIYNYFYIIYIINLIDNDFVDLRI